MDIKELQTILKEKIDLKTKLEITFQQILGQIFMLETLIEKENKKEELK